MNILFCGDNHAEDGVLITTLSLLKNTTEELHIYILTMKTENKDKQYQPFSKKAADFIRSLLVKKMLTIHWNLSIAQIYLLKSRQLLIWGRVLPHMPCLDYLQINYHKFQIEFFI